jgi:hypothetical protein
MATGPYLAFETVVEMCVTGDGMGMAATEYGRVALGRLLAFRMLARGCWEGILDGILPVVSLLLRFAMVLMESQSSEHLISDPEQYHLPTPAV